MCKLLVFTLDTFVETALSKLFKLRQLNPVFLKSTDELIEKVRYGLGDVVVLDLPPISNIQKDLKDLLDVIEEIELIVLTPYGTREKELQSFQNQHCHFLVKPIQWEELANLIQQLAKVDN